MATVHLKLGPADHGRRLSLDDFESAEYAEGFKYEIIDGRLVVAPTPNPAENALEEWIGFALREYARRHPEVLNYVTSKGRVFVHAQENATCPEPDLAAFADYPLDTPYQDIRWEAVSPLLVVEVLVEGEPKKDLQRNPALYLDVPTVKEYWVLDGRDDPNQPSLIQHRRYGKRWVVRTYPYGSEFATKLLPGFALTIAPRK